MAEEIVEVDIVEEEVIGSPNAPNKDTTTFCPSSVCTSKLCLRVLRKVGG